ncbi:MAG: SDR family oxidoreductase [Hyphomicrobiales bacterium]|nr:SDR family oxidoreductase [Hyphomicrobiales bacterium]
MYLEQYDLSSRVAVVTGGGQGIGVACAEALAEAGATVVVADMSDERAGIGRLHLSTKGYDVDTQVFDVSSSTEVDQAATEIMNRHGRVDILVANAGIVTSGTPSIDIEDEEWLRIMDVNLNGVFWCCRAFAKPMIAASKGSIVAIGSMSGIISNKPQIQPHYNASKAGVHHLAKSLAAEWAPAGVRINAVAPTYIDTPINEESKHRSEWFDEWMRGTPMGRMGEASEIASAVLFLASDASSLVTGSVLNVDGGYTCW